MQRRRIASHLIVIFAVAVVVPSIILALMAIRAIEREEAYIEKRLENTLLTEVAHVAQLVDTQTKLIQQEIVETLPVHTVDDAASKLTNWQQASELVSLPFLLSPDNEILYPNLGEKLTDEQQTFLEWGQRFFQDEVPVDVFRNLALAYQNEEAATSAIESDTAFGRTERTLSRARSKETQLAQEGLRQNQDMLAKSGKADSYQWDQNLAQQAMADFELKESVRQKAYQRAQELGQQTFQRSVLPQNQIKLSDEEQALKSVFVGESLVFSQIAAKDKTGILPRFVGNRLKLLFWHKLGTGHTIGCVLSEDTLRSRIVAALPPVYSQSRILTVLDHNVKTLFTPEGMEQRDWRRPFVAQEIGELLPRWEVAAYLTNPDIITSQAHLMRVLMWVAVLVLFVSIASGSAVVFRTLHSELTLARQKTTFVANVSHELKTPLTSIRMFAEMLRGDYQPDRDKQNQYLDIMVSETERLTRLINNILDFSKMEQGKKQYSMQSVDLVELTRSTLDSQQLALEHAGFEVMFEADAESLMCQVDGEAIRQVLLNLLSNAEKYSHETKQIQVKVGRRNDHALISVEDRGVGIEPAQAKQIFRKFYRVDDALTSRVRGTGLGLTIAQRITQDHGGDVQYIPREGGGSLFQVKLPLEEC